MNRRCRGVKPQKGREHQAEPGVAPQAAPGPLQAGINRPRVSARRWLESINGPKSPPGIASHYIEHFDVLTHGTRVVLYCRVSTLDQWQKCSLDDQIWDALRRLKELGVAVVGVVHGIECSWEMTDGRRRSLAEAIELAREHNSILVAESTSRFIRSAKYDAERHPDVQPTVWEFERLQALNHGVTLATLNDPDDSAGEERSEQTKRGHRTKNAKPGRPMRKKNRRARLMPCAIELHNEGLSLREIAKVLGIAHMTVQGWLKRACLGCTEMLSDPWRRESRTHCKLQDNGDSRGISRPSRKTSYTSLPQTVHQPHSPNCKKIGKTTI